MAWLAIPFLPTTPPILSNASRAHRKAAPSLLWLSAPSVGAEHDVLRPAETALDGCVYFGMGSAITISVGMDSANALRDSKLHRPYYIDHHYISHNYSAGWARQMRRGTTRAKPRRIIPRYSFIVRAVSTVRACQRARVNVRACVRACVRAFVRACQRAIVRVNMRACL